MELNLTGARAGGSAELHVTHARGPVRIRAVVDGVTVFEHDCPDPPCHETFRVDPDLVGRRLEVIAVSIDGTEARTSLDIEGGSGGLDRSATT